MSNTLTTRSIIDFIFRKADPILRGYERSDFLFSLIKTKKGKSLDDFIFAWKEGMIRLRNTVLSKKELEEYFQALSEYMGSLAGLVLHNCLYDPLIIEGIDLHYKFIHNRKLSPKTRSLFQKNLKVFLGYLIPDLRKLKSITVEHKLIAQEYEALVSKISSKKLKKIKKISEIKILCKGYNNFLNAGDYESLLFSKVPNQFAKILIASKYKLSSDTIRDLVSKGNNKIKTDEFFERIIKEAARLRETANNSV